MKATSQLVRACPRAEARVELGCRVVVFEARSHQAHALKLVSPGEADPERDRISTDSPLGQALLGHRPGESVVIQAPIGELHYRILEIV